MRARLPQVTIRKYMGDDAYSWAVFVDGRVVYSGESRSTAQYLRDEIKKKNADVAEARMAEALRFGLSR